MTAVHGLLVHQFRILSDQAKDGIAANEMIRRKIEKFGRHYNLIIIHFNNVSNTSNYDDSLTEQALAKSINYFYDNEHNQIGDAVTTSQKP